MVFKPHLLDIFPLPQRKDRCEKCKKFPILFKTNMALRQARTVNELKAEARALAIVGYSKMRKAELEEALLHPELHRVRKTPARLVAAGPTLKALREQAKLAGLKGYYKKNKAELLADLGRAGVAQATARMAGNEWEYRSVPLPRLRQIGRALGLPADTMTKQELDTQLKAMGIDPTGRVAGI